MNYKRDYLLPLAFIIFCVGIVGCTPQYRLQKPPTEDVRQFRYVEVSPVQVYQRLPEPLDAATAPDLRMAIVDAVTKTKRYSGVAPETDQADAAGVVVIEPTIIGYKKGDRFMRWFAGFGAGNASLDVECRFINKSSNGEIAIGVFKGEVGGGILGGSASQEKLSRLAAGKVALFMKKGK